jgi:hypothetical protein
LATKRTWAKSDPKHHAAMDAAMDAALADYEGNYPLLHGRKAIALFLGLRDGTLKDLLAAGEFRSSIRRHGRGLVADPLELWNDPWVRRERLSDSRAANRRGKRKKHGG